MINESAGEGQPVRWSNTGLLHASGDSYVRLGQASQYRNSDVEAARPETKNEALGVNNLPILSDIRRNLNILNGAAVVICSGILGAFFWIVDRIDDRFDELRVPLQDVRERNAAHGEIIRQIQTDIDRRALNAEERSISLPPAPTAP
jgi:hypothetical protein